MLSNIKSPNLYMQAAFRAQNPWEYQVNGGFQEKTYVFDFAQRTLIIYDEFANNLSNNTVNGNGTTAERKKNIQTLLNFFPVIAEDNEGKMIELDANQVLTIPKSIKAQEVIKRGFMSNLLFQNISGIFASEDTREILEQLNPVDPGKSTPRITNEAINTHDVEIDENGEVKVDSEIIISKTNAIFGDKIYDEFLYNTDKVNSNSMDNLANQIAQTYKQNTTDAVKELAKRKWFKL